MLIRFFFIYEMAKNFGKFGLLNRCSFFSKTVFLNPGTPYIRSLFPRADMMHLSKQRVIGGFNRRESEAIAWIYRSYFGRVFRLVKESTAGSPDAEDLAAEVFYKLIKFPGHFDKLKQIEYFLYRTAKNACLDYLKHQQVIKDHFPELEKYQLDIGDQESEAAEIREKFDSLIRVAAAKLSPHGRRIIILCYAHGLGNGEIARQLGLSEKTVANLKTLALKTLKLAMHSPDSGGLFKRHFL